jgi:hypothetical protein
MKLPLNHQKVRLPQHLIEVIDAYGCVIQERFAVARSLERWPSPARKEPRVPSIRGLATLKEAGQVYGGAGKCLLPSEETFLGGVSTRQTNQHLAPANKDGPRSDAARSGSAESLPPLTRETLNREAPALHHR